MNYISFVVITDTPARLRNFLVSRNVLKQVTVPISGEISYVGVLPGMEFVLVPNPIVTDPGDPNASPPVPPTHDDRNVYLVKFAHESVENEVDGPLMEGSPPAPVNQYDWSKLGKWVKANSSIVAAPVNYTINGEHAGNAYKITGENVWLVRDAPERFGVWQ